MMFDSNHSPDWIPEMDGPFAKEVEAYIRHKRALGYQYAEPICYELKSMDRLFGKMGCDGTCITRDMVDAFCAAGPGRSRSTVGKKRAVMNGFAKYLISKGWDDIALCEEGRGFRSSFAPYIFGRDEIARVFRAGAEAATDERSHSFYAAMCLCYTCGLRRSEAASLRVGDFDPDADAITVAHSKNDVTRLVAMSGSTAAVVAGHVAMLGDGGCEAYLLRGGRSFSAWSRGLYSFWHNCLAAAGVAPRADGSRQRIHDLRHSFCVRALERIAEGGRDIRSALPLLSAYLGHKSIVETEYYLRLAEPAYREVSGAAAESLPDFYGRRGHGEA